jgi:galactarate dehydratase
MHALDNVAIVANDGGLPAGTVLPEGVPGAGLVLRDKVPQGHKVALADIARGQAVLRYNVAIGYALQDIAAGSWVHERLLQLPSARALQGLPMASIAAPALPPLEGHTFEGYVNADGSVGTRNLLAIHHHRAVRRGCGGHCGRAHPARAAAAVPAGRWGGGAGAQLWLRRGH